MAATPINVVVAGGTGDLGKEITKTLRSSVYWPSAINRVVVLSRDDSSQVALELKALGAEIHTGPVTVETLKGVDVVINAWGFLVPEEVKNALAKTTAEAGVKVYFPSEFGVDPQKLGYEAKIFEAKDTQAKYAREVGGSALKIVRLYVGAFLDHLPVYAGGVGIDIPNKTLTSVGKGSTTARVTYNSHKDIAHSTARLAILAARDPSSVGDTIRISGTSTSWAELATLLSKEAGVAFEAKEVDDTPFKENIDKGDFFAGLRYAFGAGHVDLTTGNANELVNPGQELWKWDTVEEYVKKINGLSAA